MEPTESVLIVIDRGCPMIKDSDVAVQQVVDLWRSGVNMADIPNHLPGLNVAQVFAALRYATAHDLQ
jgi:uncharacterized protein (DUF433 family)